jgi:hypothetical protein
VAGTLTATTLTATPLVPQSRDRQGADKDSGKWIARRLRVLHTRRYAPPLPAKGGNWRKAKRTRESSFFSLRYPPPPAKDNWRKGSNSSRETHVLTIRQRHLAGRGRRAGGGTAIREGEAPAEPPIHPRLGRTLTIWAWRRGGGWPGCPPPRHQKRGLGGVGLAITAWRMGSYDSTPFPRRHPAIMADQWPIASGCHARRGERFQSWPLFRRPVKRRERAARNRRQGPPITSTPIR